MINQILRSLPERHFIAEFRGKIRCIRKLFVTTDNIERKRWIVEVRVSNHRWIVEFMNETSQARSKSIIVQDHIESKVAAIIQQRFEPIAAAEALTSNGRISRQELQ